MHRGVDTWIVFGRQRGKTRAPIQGLSIRWGFSRYEAKKMSGAIQSSDYVPGVSGWKLNTLTGEFEINSARPHSGVEAQMITVTAGEWSEYDLPANAIERYAFIGAEVAKIPAEYRDKAEFATKDFSFDCDGSDVRTTLTYERQEAPEEIVARLEKAKVAGSHISIKNGLMSVSHDGVARFKIGNLDQSGQPQLFKVDGDQAFINKAAIQDSIIKSPLWAAWGVRMQLCENGKYYAAGIGLPSQILVSADRFAIKDEARPDDSGDALAMALKKWDGIGSALKAGGIATAIDKVTIRELTGFEKALAEGDASKILDMLAGKIDETRLGQELKEQVDLLGSSLADHVKAVIRKELMPGGLLHRSR